MSAFEDMDELLVFGNRTSSSVDGLYTHLHFDSGVTLVVYRYGEPPSLDWTTNRIDTRRIVSITVDFIKAERGEWSLEGY